MDRREMAERLREAYEASGKSYADLSGATGIPKSMIQRYFSGAVGRIPVDRLQALCRELGLDVEDMLGWEPEGKTRADGRVYRGMTPRQAELFDAVADLNPAEQEAVLAVIRALRCNRGLRGK